MKFFESKKDSLCTRLIKDVCVKDVCAENEAPVETDSTPDSGKSLAPRRLTLPKKISVRQKMAILGIISTGMTVLLRMAAQSYHPDDTEYPEIAPKSLKSESQAVIQVQGVGTGPTGEFEKGGKTREEKEAASRASDRMLAIPLIADYGRFKVNGVSGRSWGLPLGTEIPISERITIGLGVPLTYVGIGEAGAWGAGLSVSLPIKICGLDKDSKLEWKLTPALGANGLTSSDLKLGGVIANAGLTNLLSWNFKGFTLSVANQFTAHENTNMKFGGYRYENVVSQRILRNGVKLDVPIGKRWVADTYVIHTDLSGSQVMSAFMSYGADLSFRILGKDRVKDARLGFLTAGFRFDTGANYRAANLEIGSGWRF